MIAIADALKMGLPLGSAVLLSQVTFWHPKAKAQFGGKRWWATTRLELADLTGLSPRRIRTALEDLKERGLVQVERHMFNGVCQSFIRPLQVPLHNGTGVPLRNGTGVPLRNGTHMPLPYTEESTEVSTEESTDSSGVLKHARTSGFSKESKITGEMQTEKTTPHSPPSAPLENTAMKVADVLKNAPRRKMPPKGTGASLEASWRSAVVARYGGFSAPFTVKQKAQAKYVLTVWEGHPCEEIVAVVVGQWEAYVEAVKSAAGLYVVPEKPNLDFLVKYAGEAVTFWLKSTKPKKGKLVVVKAKPKPTVEAKPVQSTALSPYLAPKATKEELLKILGDGE